MLSFHVDADLDILYGKLTARSGNWLGWGA